jgi:polysaccharide biosynthesis protein PslG
MPRRFPRIVALLAGLIFAGGALVVLAPLSAAQRRAAPPKAAAGSGPTPIVGLIAGTAQWRGAGMNQRLNQVVGTSGAKWLREGFYWYRIEPKPGNFNFAHYDRFMMLAAKHRVHLLVELWMAPRWAAPTPTAVPADPTAYAAYVAAVVGRYGPGGTFWAAHPNLADYAVPTFEIWNEAYYSNGNGGRYDPARYARLVKAAVTAGRAADPVAKFLIGAEMEGEFVQSRAQGRSWVWWVNAMYRAVPDLNNYFDGISVHPYGHDITHRSPAIYGQPYYGYDQMRRIELIREQFVSHGAADKPFWVTEVGWPTCTHGTIRCVTPAGQRTSLDTLMRYARTTWSSYVKAVFVFYYDDVGANSADPMNDYGLIYFDRKPKPAFGAFRAFAKLSPATNTWP